MPKPAARTLTPDEDLERGVLIALDQLFRHASPLMTERTMGLVAAFIASKKGKTVFYHMTTADSAVSILMSGFRQSSIPRGGVFFSNSPKWLPRDRLVNWPTTPIILEVEIDSALEDLWRFRSHISTHPAGYQGPRYAEWCFPAEFVNARILRITARCLPRDERNDPIAAPD